MLEPKVIDLNTVVAQMETMLRARRRAHRAHRRRAPARVPVKADPDQLERALLNMAINARDAMPEAALAIETRNVALPRPDAALSPMPARRT